MQASLRQGLEPGGLEPGRDGASARCSRGFTCDVFDYNIM